MGRAGTEKETTDKTPTQLEMPSVKQNIGKGQLVDPRSQGQLVDLGTLRFKAKTLYRTTGRPAF